MLETIFALPHEFVVPDVLYDREMQGEWGERLVALGLRVEEVTEVGVRNALRYRQQRSALSVPDSFALALAKEREWLLLTGDGQLRDLAAGENVECHGVLWLLDMMEEAGTPGIQPLHDGLAALSAHPRCRLHRDASLFRTPLSSVSNNFNGCRGTAKYWKHVQDTRIVGDRRG